MRMGYLQYQEFDQLQIYSSHHINQLLIAKNKWNILSSCDSLLRGILLDGNCKMAYKLFVPKSRFASLTNVDDISEVTNEGA